MIFLGCDGGSTKTEFVLTDEYGKILAHKRFPGCNYAFLGEKGLNILMKSSIDELLGAARILPHNIDGAMFSLSSFGEIEGAEDITYNILKEALPECKKLLVDNDSVAAWAGSLVLESGISVVSGTGSIAYGRDEEGKGQRVGGWSLFFGDEGSCSWIGRQLAARFMREADGRDEKTGIYEQVMHDLGLSRDRYFTEFLQSKVRQDSALLAKLQESALMLAKKGNKTVLEYYRAAAYELKEMACAVRDSLNFENENVSLSYAGGLFKAGSIFLDPFEEVTEKEGFRLQTPKYGPLIGALLLASENVIGENQQKILAKNAAEVLE